MNNLIIYDFDDTLFPSFSYVMHMIDFNDVEAFNEIDNIMFELLKYSLSIAEVIIISDGDIGWLLEILNHLPKSFKLINDQIEIVSTVNYYSHLFRKNVNEYKLNYILENINIREYDNIINIGDGKNELYATTSINEIFGNKIKHILDLCDFLVDGPFDINRRNVSLKFRGSDNQRIINLKTGEVIE